MSAPPGQQDDAQSVQIPARLADRPRDRRGYPIPWTVKLDLDGRPDFRVIDVEKVALAVNLKRCAMCGQALGRHLAFIGGPVSFQTRLFTDMPMHKDCAMYAIQVCPWLAAPNMRYAEQLPQMSGAVTVVHTEEMVPERPARFFIATTKACRLVRTPGGAVVMQADPWEWHEWWRHGQRLNAMEE
jgi:hypothetical protein